MMINFAPTSRSAIRPSGDTLDLVRPGMSRVVARTLDGVEVPEIDPRAFLTIYVSVLWPYVCLMKLTSADWLVQKARVCLRGQVRHRYGE